MYACMCTHISTCTHVYEYMNMQLHRHMCAHMETHTFTCTYVCTYMNTHTCIGKPKQ